MNPTGLLLIAFCAVVGALLGDFLLGLAVGLSIVLWAHLTT